MTAFVREKRVRFHYCDPAGIIFYPNYLVLTNETVEDWFRDGLGTDFHALHQELGRGIPMRHMECDFMAASRYGELLQYTLVVERVGNTSLAIRVSARCGDELRYQARQTLVWADVQGPRPTPIEPEWRERFAAFMEETA